MICGNKQDIEKILPYVSEGLQKALQYIEEKDHVVLQTGDFAVFFPWELHRPGCSTKNGMQEVQKIVVKIKHKNQ